MTFELNEQQVRTLKCCLRHTRWAAEQAVKSTSGVAWYACRHLDQEIAELQEIFGKDEG